MEIHASDAILGGCLGIMTFLGKWMLTRMQKQMDEATKKVSEIQLNYLDRFADLKGQMTEGHAQITDAINGLRLDLAKNYVTKDDCPQLHK